MSLPSIEDAYKALKRIIYRDNLDFVSRLRLAEFESSDDFKPQLEILQTLVDLIDTQDLVASPEVQGWLQEINFYILPKKVALTKDEAKSDHRFLTNIRTSDTYTVSDVTYFIDLPVALRILDVLWVMTSGRLIDAKLPDSVYGNRLNTESDNPDCPTYDLFKYYVSQYSKWRDTAIKTALDLLEKHDSSAAVFSLDIKQYYYHIYIDYTELKESILELCNQSSDFEHCAVLTSLTNLLHAVHVRYFEAIAEYLQITHSHLGDDIGNQESGGLIPIGLASSYILSNWYLSDFDKKVVQEANPAFYGRYVDDIIVVVQNPIITPNDNKRQQFVERYFPNLINYEDGTYIIQSRGGLPVQDDKLLLHHYDKEHSQAGLRFFLKDLENNNSAFRFLPSSDVDKELDEIAYDLIREGSVNKLRSVVGLRENAVELSKYLAMQIIAHRLSEETKPAREKLIEQLFKFFQGKNFLDFCRLWEKVFSFAIIEDRLADASRFYERAKGLLNDLVYKDDDGLVLWKLQDSLRLYLDISLALPCGLLGIDENLYAKSRRFYHLIVDDDNTQSNSIKSKAKAFRQSNLIRHNYVEFPLINYTFYFGNLIKIDYKGLASLLQESEDFLWLIPDKIRYSPRYIHLDELQLVYFLKSLFMQSPPKEGWLASGISEVTELKEEGLVGMLLPELTSNYGYPKDVRTTRVAVGDSNRAGKLKVAIANMHVAEADYIASYRRDRSPNVSSERQSRLFSVLNAAEQERADLLVFPEVSIPHRWLPVMVSHSRRKQIALVFGLEHWVINRRAYNFIVTTLPFKMCGVYDACLVCIRTKNHYAPKETVELKKARVQPAEPDVKEYFLISWQGIQFAPYNCFELADINHRGLFRSDLDLLVACVWNKDTNYYNNIMELVARDIHCYAVQANTSQFGGSCVMQPSKTETLDIIKVKGGENTCILTATLDIKELRDFQFQDYSEVDKRFKPTPPGYDHEAVLRRGM